MRRRLLLLASFTGTLFACASVLGDFDVEPAGSNPDASTLTDASSSSSGSGGEGGTTDSGTDAGPTAQPIGLQVAASTSATCATVQYPSQKQVTYCWGAENAKFPSHTVGAQDGDPRFEGFARPRLPTADVRYLTFSSLTGSGTGGWFVGRGSDSQTTATFTWGQNESGECAAGAPTSTAPFALKSGATLLQFDSIYAAPTHGCLVQKQKFYCWGNNSNCELRAGTDSASCNAAAPVLAEKNSRVVEDEGSFESGLGKTILRMAGGLDHSCTQVRAAGTGADTMDDVLCWGTNVSGQVDSTLAATFVGTPTKVTQVRRGVAELAAGENHTCAITDASTITCWGKNDAGQVNPANPGPKAKASSLAGMPGVLSNVRAAGDLSCVVSKVLGQASRAWCWGNGPKGRAPSDQDAQLGKVAGIQDVTQLAIGRAHACAVARKEGASDKDPARVWCWGQNDFKRVNPRAAVGQLIVQPVEIVFPPEPTN